MTCLEAKMVTPEITAFNIGMLPADLSNWFGLAAAHPYSGHSQNLPMQCYLIRLPGRIVLVDAPAYEFPGDTSMLLPAYRGRSAASLLAESGIAPEEVTDVVITHPHLDHTLGLARPVGNPSEVVFPNARHYLGARDWDPEKMEEAERQPLEILQDAGLLTLVDGQLDLGDGLTIIPAPGETPGHQILWLKDARDGDAYFVGDLFHHVLEFEQLGEHHPIWADAKAMEASKLMLAERAASTNAQIFFTHIEGPCRVERDGNLPGRYHFTVEQASL
jgi:glyoxylase-like metal-dependent hydrolase (beta-lactamase superfamily II)